MAISPLAPQPGSDRTPNSSPTARNSTFAVLASAALLLSPPATAQQQATEVMGAIATRDARVTGGLEVDGDIARLFTNVGITAFNHDAAIALHRGGHVLVCSTSEFHLLHSGANGSLVFGLDRGAMEIFSDSKPQDALLTPDLKFTPVTNGQLDLKLRVTREGDTCVDNTGASAPVLNVTDPFSSESYRILPNQHLLFVKGDLHKVVDHERSPCGCPPQTPQQLAAKPGKPLTPAQAAAAAHPFPQAQSVGLAPTTDAANAAPPGTASSQVSTTFSYGEGQGPPPSAGPEPATASPGATTGEPPRKSGFFHAIGRFFHRLFHPANAEPGAAPSPASPAAR